jgi:hypothetical protein
MPVFRISMISNLLECIPARRYDVAGDGAVQGGEKCFGFQIYGKAAPVPVTHRPHFHHASGDERRIGAKVVGTGYRRHFHNGNRQFPMGPIPNDRASEGNAMAKHVPELTLSRSGG